VRFHFFDNLDGRTLEQVLRTLELKTTRFLAVSKSGGTPETVVQMVVTLDALTAPGLDWNAAAHMVALSEPGARRRTRCAGWPSATSSRRSTTTRASAGAIRCCPTSACCRPCSWTSTWWRCGRAPARCWTSCSPPTPPADVAPALGAAAVMALTRHHGLNAVIMMPYGDRLRLFSSWFAQLWAESLGKGGQGTQPVAAAGPVDQHSCCSCSSTARPTSFSPSSCRRPPATGPGCRTSTAADPLIGYLAGRTVGDLTDCQARATAETFARNGRPVRTLAIDRLDERTLGGLLMHFMLETIIMGLMLDLDPFDQPAVEQSKILTREYLETM
jgi:glucose-6-phosphate isomerase